MGLFKSEEDKRAAAQQKAAEQAAKERELLRKYGLDFEHYDDDDLQSALFQGIKNVNASMAGTGLYEFGSLLPGGNSDAAMQMALLKAQLEQGWIIVRQNEQMIRLLREIKENTDGIVFEEAEE